MDFTSTDSPRGLSLFIICSLKLGRDDKFFVGHLRAPAFQRLRAGHSPLGVRFFVDYASVNITPVLAHMLLPE
jgi:hypothetical protein